jgi:protein-S-isoprenylcysteine O-methyltransferase Ste14
MNEGIFRLLTLVLLLAFALVWGINLLRVGISRDVLYSKHESLWFALVSRGLIAASIVGAVAFVDDPQSAAWSHLELPSSVRLIGIPVGSGGIALLWWVLSTLGRNFSMSLPTEGHALVTDGPYRWVRHPMYTAFAAVFTGLFLTSANWFVGATAGIALGAVMVIRTPREERTLLGAFGERYQTYMRHTGRFFPKAGCLTRRAS